MVEVVRPVVAQEEAVRQVVVQEEVAQVEVARPAVVQAEATHQVVEVVRPEAILRQHQLLQHRE